MSNSLEKIQALRDELTGPPSADPDPLELTLRTIAHIAGPALMPELPSDPRDVDGFLEEAALRILAMRSDGVPVSSTFALKLGQLVRAEIRAEAQAPPAHAELEGQTAIPVEPSPPAAPEQMPEPEVYGAYARAAAAAMRPEPPAAADEPEPAPPGDVAPPAAWSPGG